MNRGIVALLVAAAVRATPAAAQADASVGVGVGTVRYQGGSSFSSAALSPALHYASPAFVADVSGSIASLPDTVTVWSSQGRADLWAATPALTDGFRLAAGAMLAGSTRSDGGRTAGAQAIGEVLWSAPKWGAGVGAGPAGGWIADQPSVVALHTRGRVWWRPSGEAGGTDWQASVEPTRFLGAWFTDLSAGVTMTRGRAVMSFWMAARLSTTYVSKGAGSALLQLFVSPSVSLELGGGSYLPDPYQGFPQAGFVAVGLRLHGAPRARRTAPAPAPTAAPTPQWTPLVPEARGDSLVVRFHMAQAGAVAIAGDWNAWQPLPLRPVGDDVWEGALVLPRGLYHFNLLVDGADWVVPNGVATVSDGLGGMVGVLVVP